MELLKLASEAGKLGISGAGNIKKFVKEADMINVALGEDLGEGAILSIGKLSDVFGTGMLNIGSAINSLGAASAASEGYLVDFAARLGGVAKTAGISAPDILGYGAVLDSLGLQAEMSGTALSNFFIDFTKNVGKFEGVAGMAKGSLQELIGKEGTNAGFMAFLENLKASSSGADDFLRKLEKLGIDGSRGAQVFLTLSNNIGMVKDQQKIANAEFDKGTSIVDEFNIKNNNFAASLEKLQKKIASLLTDNFIVNGIKFLVMALVNGMDSIGNAFNAATAPISGYIDKVGELFRGIGILLQKTELGNKILNYTALVWGYVAKGVGLVYDGLVGLINGFEKAIATAAGVKAGFETLVEYFRTTVRQAFEGIAQMIEGVFSLDAAKIKQGTAALSGAFSTLGKSVADSFVKSYNNTMKVFAPIPKSSLDMTVTGGEKSSAGVDFGGSGTIDELTDEQKKKQSKEKDQLQKHLDELMRLRIDNMEDESAKAEAKADYEFYKLVTQAQKEITNKKVLNDTLIELQLQYDTKLAAIREDASKKRLDALAQELDDYVKTEEWAQLELERAIVESLTGVKFGSKPKEDTGKSKFGVSEERWGEVKEQGNETINAVADWGNAAIGMIDAVTARQRAELEEFLSQQEQKKRSIQDLYEAGKLSAEDYGKKVRAIDVESENKRREFGVKAARREKAIAIFNSIINTAAAIVKALPNVPLAVATGIMGTAQTGLIAATPIPAFAKGGSTFANGGGVMKPRLGLIGEKGPEWVAPNWMLRDPATADVIGALEAIRQNRTSAFADGGSTTSAVKTNMAGLGVGSNGELVSMMKSMQQTNMMLLDRLNKPFNGVIGWNDGDTRELEEKRTRYSDILNDNTLS
jgi:TP901 family phage tail tape measure protein